MILTVNTIENEKRVGRHSKFFIHQFRVKTLFYCFARLFMIIFLFLTVKKVLIYFHNRMTFVPLIKQ